MIVGAAKVAATVENIAISVLTDIVVLLLQRMMVPQVRILSKPGQIPSFRPSLCFNEFQTLEPDLFDDQVFNVLLFFVRLSEIDQLSKFPGGWSPLPNRPGRESNV